MDDVETPPVVDEIRDAVSSEDPSEIQLAAFPPTPSGRLEAISDTFRIHFQGYRPATAGTRRRAASQALPS